MFWLIIVIAVFETLNSARRSEFTDILSLYDFLNIIRLIKFFYVAIQKSLIEYFIKRVEKTIFMKKLLKNYWNHVKLIRILIKSKKKFHIQFSQFYRTNHLIKKFKKMKKKSKKSKKKCFCDEKHNWFKCFYLISIIRSFDWTFDVIIEKKVVKKMKKKSTIDENN